MNLSNFNASNQIISNDDMGNAEEITKKFMYHKNGIEEICCIENLIVSYNNAKDKYNELDSKNLFIDKNSIYKDIYNKRLEDMKLILEESDPEILMLFKFFNLHNTCISWYLKIMEENK